MSWIAWRQQTRETYPWSVDVMRIPAPEPRQDSENVLPLINVVFLMLIFFMLTAAIEPPEPFEVDPPQSLDHPRTGAANDVVVLDTLDRIAFANREVTRSELLSMVASGSMSAVTGQVKLKVDANVEALKLISLIEDLERAGMKQIKLLTVPSPG